MANATRDTADAQYDVAIAQAEATMKVEKEKCDALGGDAQEACHDTAESSFEMAKADAQLKRDAARQAAAAQDD